jgi:hypothetical protein
MPLSLRPFLLLALFVLVAAVRAEGDREGEGESESAGESGGAVMGPFDAPLGGRGRQQAMRALFHSLSGMSPGTAHVVHLPPALEGMIEGMIEGMLSGGLDLRRRSLVEFTYADTNKSRLLAKVALPSAGNGSAERKIRIQITGSGGHMRVRVINSRQMFEHVIPLPLLVSPDGIEASAEVDGSVTVSLKVLSEKSSLNHVPRMNDVSLSRLLFGENVDSMDSAPTVAAEAAGNEHADSEIVHELPSTSQVKACVEKYAGTEYRLLAKQCLCMASRDEDSRLACFASLLSSAIRIARRVSRDGFATDAKHQAIDCADHVPGKAICLETLTSNVLLTLYGNVTNEGEPLKVEDRLLKAFESEDDGASEPVGLTVSVWTLLCVVLIVVFVLVLLMVCLMKAFFSSQSTSRPDGGHHKLSSILSQFSSAVAATSSHPRVAGSSRKLADD